MSLIYRGRKFDAYNVATQTVSTAATGTYRGASVEFRRAAQASRQPASTKQYRGVTY